MENPTSLDVSLELQKAAERAATGIRDPQIMKEACERMDRMREEIFKKYGLQNIGVQIIREMRDGECST